jgi:hypothetical protein
LPRDRHRAITAPLSALAVDPLDRGGLDRLTVDEWRTTATAIMLSPLKFDNNRLFLGYVKNQLRFRIRLLKFHFLGQVEN